MKFDIRGLFEKIFRPEKNRQAEQALTNASGLFETITGYQPTFSTWQGEIYESGLVRAAIDARARHISKLDVQIHGAANPALQTALRRGPNPWQTWSQFLYRTSTILDIHNTCVILPVLDNNLNLSGFFPVVPINCELVDYNGEPWLRCQFARGGPAAVELRSCAVLTKHQYRNDFFGENNNALNAAMKLIRIQNKGIEEAVKNSATYRFMARINNYSLPDDLAKERQRFTEKNLSAEAENAGGVLLFPNTYSDIQQIRYSPYTVDAAQMQLIHESVSNYFGVNAKVMQNSATPEELDAFFNGAIEPFAIQFSEALSRAAFTDRERAQGSHITANADRLQYMTTREKVEMARQLGDRGAMTIDEIRKLFNYEPLPDGVGARIPIRGEYYFVGEDRRSGKQSKRKGDDSNAANGDKDA